MSKESNQQCKEYFGYKHYTNEKNPRCFYVGKGKQRRPYQLKRNKKHNNVLNKYGCNVVVCVGPISNSDACDWEKREIQNENTYHYVDPNGIGCNFTLGGEGTPGSHHNLGKSKPPFSRKHCQALKLARKNQDMSKHASSISQLIWVCHPKLGTKRIKKSKKKSFESNGWILGRTWKT